MQPQTPASGTTRQPRQPRIFYGWYLVAGSILTNTVLSAAYFQGMSAFAVSIEAHFGWSRSVVGGAMSMRQMESGITSPLDGILLDKVKPRTLLFWSAIITGIGMIGLGLVNGILTFYLAIFVISIGTSGMSHAVTWPVLIARWFRRNLGTATGWAVMGPIFGSPFVILNTSLEETYGWRTIIIAYGVIVLLFLTLISAVARERPEPYGMRPDGDPPERDDRGAAIRTIPPARGMNARSAMRTREFWLFMGYLSGMFMVNSAFQVHQIFYFVEDTGLTKSEAAVTFTLVFLLSGIGRLGAGYMLDKADYRLLLAVVAGMLTASMLYLQFVTATTILLAMPFVALFGIGFGSVIPTRGTLGSMMFGTRSLGSIVGMLQGGSVAAGVVGPIFMARVFDITGDYRAAIWALAFIGALMIPTALAMGSPRRLSARVRLVERQASAAARDSERRG
ncbi:MAG: MFS transporter [Chloroflexi bacterium]|nr:MFS transporter [Chloroflexota bacterium]